MNEQMLFIQPGLTNEERALLKQWREQGRQRTVSGVVETLVCLPISFWVAADDLDSAAHQAGALIEEKIAVVAWDGDAMGRGVAAQKRKARRRRLRARLFGRGQK
jgi:hypothetical protein